MSRDPHDGPEAAPLSRRTVLAALGAASVVPAAAADTASASAIDAEAGTPGTAPAAPPTREETQARYLEMVRSIQLAHSRLQSVVEDALQRNGRFDLTGVEGMTLLNAATEGATMSTLRRASCVPDRKAHAALVYGLARRGFLQIATQRRPYTVALTATGREAAALVMAEFDRQAGNAGRWGGVGPDQMAATQSTLARLDRFWTDIMVYQI